MPNRFIFSAGASPKASADCVRGQRPSFFAQRYNAFSSVSHSIKMKLRLHLKLHPCVASSPSLSYFLYSLTLFSPESTSLISHSNPWLRVCFWENLTYDNMWVKMLYKLYIGHPYVLICLWHPAVCLLSQCNY